MKKPAKQMPEKQKTARKPPRQKRDPLAKVLADWNQEDIRLKVFNQVMQEQARKKVN